MKMDDQAQRKRAQAALKGAHDELEARVQKRTAELSRANALLREQIKGRERIEAALRESEQRFRRAFDHAAIGMALVKPDFTYYRVNASLCKMLGYSEGELLEKTFPSITHPEDLESEELDKTRQVLEGEIESFRQEKRYFHKDGHIVWALMTVALVRDDDGIPLYFVAEIEDITERKKAERELRRSHQELRRLSGHLESVREEERTRVAREIHDELGQALTGLKLDLAWLAQQLEPGQENLIGHTRKMSDLVDETIKSVRSILTALRPAILDDLGLAAAIEWQAQDFRERTKIECQLDLEADEARLAQDRATAVFRIFQETLTNVARHAQADRVCIRLQETAENLVLTVRDNGTGVAAHEMAKPNSFGILGMRERALLLGGEVQIEGARGKGTTVTVQIPLQNAEVE